MNKKQGCVKSVDTSTLRNAQSSSESGNSKEKKEDYSH